MCCGKPERERERERQSKHDSASIMSDVTHTSVHQLCRIHLSISLTFPHLHGTSMTGSNQFMLIPDCQFL
jgi:hypothetical protein